MATKSFNVSNADFEIDDDARRPVQIGFLAPNDRYRSSYLNDLFRFDCIRRRSVIVDAPHLEAGASSTNAPPGNQGHLEFFFTDMAPLRLFHETEHNRGL
uniref:Uncharacterized protein n=1 Tax=Romanomermis culicivorax TaxID=13658 RepID=A0A915J0D9_ROMCU